MKTNFNNYRIIIVALTFILTGCDNGLQPENSIDTNATFIKAYATNGFTDGKINQSIDITIEFNHPRSGLEVKQVLKNVIDGFTTKYVIVAGNSVNDQKDQFDTVTVDYFIEDPGFHKLNFFYKLENNEEEFLGDFEFSIDN